MAVHEDLHEEAATMTHRRSMEDENERIRTCALEMVQELLDEAIAVVDGPLSDAARLRDQLAVAARAAASARDKDVIAYARAERRRVHLESLVAMIREVRDHAKKGRT